MDALPALTLNQLKTAHLIVVEGMSVREAAAELGVSRQVVERRWHRIQQSCVNLARPYRPPQPREQPLRPIHLGRIAA